MDKQQAIKKLTLAWLEYQLIDKQSNIGLTEYNDWVKAHAEYRGYRRGLIDSGVIGWDDIDGVEGHQLSITKP